jgi:hypothetical protein
MSNIVNLSNVLPSKENLKAIVQNLTHEVFEGTTDPIRLSALLDFVIKACTEAKASIKEETITQLEKDPLRKDYFGYKIEVTEAGVNYDYSGCNDPELKALYTRLELIKESIKDKETFLKSIKGHATLVIEETGEVVTVYPPVKRSSTTPKFSLK